MQEQVQTFFCEKCNEERKIPKNYLGKNDAIQKAKAKHEHKEHALILGIKFKIYPEKQDLEKLNNYFDEYAKAVTFAARVIDKLKSPFLFAGKRNKEEKGKKWIFPIDDCNLCNKKKEIAYQNSKGKKICNSCYLLEFGENGIRKRIYATRGRKVDSNFNILNATSILSGTHYNFVVRDAFQLLDALKKQRNKRIKKLIRDKARLKQFEDMLKDEDKRFPLPRTRREQQKFIHINLKDRASEFKGYTLKKIKGKIKILSRNIEREEKSLRKKSPINFKGNRILLHPSIKFNDENNKVKMAISKNLPNEFTFSGLNVANEHGRKFFAEKLKLIKENKPKYAYLLRKKINKSQNKSIYDYYLQYTVEFLPETKNKYKGILGIDRGINTLACVVLLENGKNKPSFVRFFSGKGILILKNQRRKQLYFLKGTHNKKKKQKKIRPIEPRIDQIIHNVSKQIVEFAKSREVAIALEQLEKPRKGRYRQSRHLSYKLAQFNFKTLSTYIEYKAKKDGIKVIYIPPEMTSQTCSHCSSLNTQRPYKKPNAKKAKTSLFKCNDCGVELNSDYNASFNIAQKGLKILNAN
ncbi:MAG: transposase [Nanoarchaeota archaeon]